MKHSVLGMPEKIPSWFYYFNNFIINLVITIILQLRQGFLSALGCELQQDSNSSVYTVSTDTSVLHFTMILLYF